MIYHSCYKCQDSPYGYATLIFIQSDRVLDYRNKRKSKSVNFCYSPIIKNGLYDEYINIKHGSGEEQL